MASSSDKLLKAARAWVGQIGSGGVADATTTTIPLSSTTNLPTDTAVVATIDRVDSNGVATPSLEEVVIGVVSGSNLITSTRGVEGTAQAHSAGAVVEILMTATNWNYLITHLLVGHNQDGSHGASAIVASNLAASSVSAGRLAASAVLAGNLAASAVLAGNIGASAVLAGNMGFAIPGSDGWVDANEAWTYASATTITVPTGAAAKYKKGDKIKLTQTTVKYFYIVAVADTLLTITGGSDYTLINAAISANYYSHSASPIGFPDWFNYTPTLSCSGSMTIGSVSVTESQFAIIGTTCFYRLSAKGTTAGTAAGNIITTVPVNRLSTAAFVNANMVGVYDGGGLLGGVSVWSNTAQNSLLTARYDEANFGLGGGRGIDGTFIYPI